ncbi:hypothetical protein [Propionivibrio sp.]|uniref:hypothetical protein n=1 Tax=Propionivibrio sp. TaxID=2212460 RepID=UPI003BF2BC35
MQKIKGAMESLVSCGNELFGVKLDQARNEREAWPRATVNQCINVKTNGYLHSEVGTSTSQSILQNLRHVQNMVGYRIIPYSPFRALHGWKAKWLRWHSNQNRPWATMHGWPHNGHQRALSCSSWNACFWPESGHSVSVLEWRLLTGTAS